MKKKNGRLLVVGAGPKAAAIAAKSKVLRQFGQPAPEVWVAERYQHCANWTGQYGFTNGRQTLGTPPEKDIGFPYVLDKKEEVTEELFRRYSWGSYLNFEKGTFGEWIDRGRPAPRHDEWAAYLRHVLGAADNVLREARVTELKIENGEWVARIRVKGRLKEERFSGVVITGPGEKKMPAFKVPKDPKIEFGDTFWKNPDIVAHINGDDPRPVIVIGGGETAAAIVSYLVDELDQIDTPIFVFTRSGAIFSRGEGYYENRRFTDSSGWRDLPLEVRREVIDRSDRGVFSIETMRKLASSGRVRHLFLEVRGIKIDARGHVCVEGRARDGGDVSYPCQLAILALGFDPFSFIDLLSSELRERLDALGPEDRKRPDWKGERNRAIECRIEKDLSLPKEIMPAKLYLPMISGVAQGPGFPNLSCLGNLSDRILGR